MITLYGFGRVHPMVVSLTRDLRVEWALEELGLPYKVKGLDHTAGEFESPAFDKISPFHQAPIIDDEGFVVAESASILLYLAEKAGKLIPDDAQGRTRVAQWCFAALTTIEPPLMQIAMIDMSEAGKEARKWREELMSWTTRVLKEAERRLQGREWIACKEFTVADILLATVLRINRKKGLIDPYPNLKSYFERAQARPAWQRTLKLHAERLGVTVADMQ